MRPSVRGGSRVTARTARAVSAQQTRVKVARAAAVLFTERGYGATTLRDIADHAGVSVETVGLLGPKRRLLRAAFDMVFAGDSAAFPVGPEPAYIRLMEENDFPTAVRAYTELLAASIARSSGLWRAFQAAADADPKAAESFAEVRAVRRQEFHRTASWLAENGIVPEAAIPLLVQQFYLIASHEVFLLLQDECGFTPEQFGARLHEQVRQILAPVD